MTTGPDLIRRVCRHDIGHTGRCADGLGGSWENNHPDCEEAVRWKRWGRIAMEERDRAERDLARLRKAVAVLLDDHARTLLADAAQPSLFALTDTSTQPRNGEHE